MAFGFNNKNGKTQVGMTDVNSCHIGDDKFDIDNYIHGLRDFIMHCNTPMTIAIQGDWGTGKTSIMEMVIDDIEKSQEADNTKKITSIKFNTWEYSQFNLAAQLPMVMIDALVNQIKKSVEEKTGNEESKKKLKEYSEKIGNFVSVFATVSLSMVTKGMVQLDAENIKSLLPTGSISGISELKDNFSAAVSSVAEGENDKLVIFIDDLDRLDPALAVEILEVLKIFLESPKCVFVLAIDYSVVQRGVKAKYGADFDEEKGKNFFDKIIQVPFQVPVGNYNLKKYVGKCIEESNLNSELEKESEAFIGLIENSVGKNPRAIKRIFNALLLLQMVAMNTEASKTVFDDKGKVMLLFAMLCLQQACPTVYDFFAMNKDSIDGYSLEALKNKGQDEINRELDIDLGQEEFERMKRFIPGLYNLVNTDKVEGISKDEIIRLKDVLALSAITGKESGTESRGSEQLSEAEFNEKCKYKENSPDQYAKFIDIIEDLCPEGHVTRKWCNSGYVVATGDFDQYASTFCSLDERAKGICAYFYVPSEGDFKKLPDEVRSLMPEEARPKGKEKYIRINLNADNEKDISIFTGLISFSYEKYKAKIMK